MDTIEDVIAHYGVKGMKWGVRKKSGPSEPSSEEHSKTIATRSRTKASKGSTHMLTNKELQDAITRMNLEQNYARLTYQPTKLQKGKNVALKLIGVARTAGKGTNEILAFNNSPAGKMIRDEIQKRKNTSPE